MSPDNRESNGTKDELLRALVNASIDQGREAIKATKDAGDQMTAAVRAMGESVGAAIAEADRRAAERHAALIPAEEMRAMLKTAQDSREWVAKSWPAVAARYAWPVIALVAVVLAMLMAWGAEGTSKAVHGAPPPAKTEQAPAASPTGALPAAPPGYRLVREDAAEPVEPYLKGGYIDGVDRARYRDQFGEPYTGE